MEKKFPRWRRYAAYITPDIASPENPIIIDKLALGERDQYTIGNIAAVKRNGHWSYRSADPAKIDDPWNFWRTVVHPCDDQKFNQVADERMDEIEIWGAFDRNPFR